MKKNKRHSKNGEENEKEQPVNRPMTRIECVSKRLRKPILDSFARNVNTEWREFVQEVVTVLMIC